MSSLKDTYAHTDQHPEGGNSTKPKFDQLKNTNAEATSRKTREEALNTLNGHSNKLDKDPERHIQLRKVALLKAGLSSTQILSICEANTRILKLEKHKYWITVTILMTKNPPPEILYDILIRNPSRIDLEREYKKMPKYKKIIP